MDRQHLHRIVDLYQHRLTKGALISGSKMSPWAYRHDILGACLMHAGVDPDALRSFNFLGVEHVWAYWSEQLKTQGIETVEEAAALMAANDADRWADGKQHTVAQSLFIFLERVRPIPPLDRSSFLARATA